MWIMNEIKLKVVILGIHYSGMVAAKSVYAKSSR